MNAVKIIDPSDRNLQLAGALLMYRSDCGAVYATTHQIDLDPANPARPLIGAGTPLTSAALMSFARAVQADLAPSGFVHDRLLYAAGDMQAWWTPAQVRPTWFKSSNKRIGERAGPAAHPPLVFVSRSSAWYVFALKQNERPSQDTKLCIAPHFNVWAGGQICTGNVRLPKSTGAEAISAYEHAFFRSRFTHPNQQNAVRYRGGAYSLWRDQLDRPDLARMQKALRPAGETLQEAITRITTHHPR